MSINFGNKIQCGQTKFINFNLSYYQLTIIVTKIKFLWFYRSSHFSLITTVLTVTFPLITKILISLKPYKTNVSIIESDAIRIVVGEYRE